MEGLRFDKIDAVQTGIKDTKTIRFSQFYL